MQHRSLMEGQNARLSRVLGAALRASALLTALSLAPACAPTAQTKAGKGTTAELIEEGHRRGISLKDPLELDRSIIRDAKEKLGTWGDPVERLRRLIFFLNDSAEGGFHYAPNLSFTAA